jgi:hypothetical protein
MEIAGKFFLTYGFLMVILAFNHRLNSQFSKEGVIMPYVEPAMYVLSVEEKVALGLDMATQVVVRIPGEAVLARMATRVKSRSDELAAVADRFDSSNLTAVLIEADRLRDMSTRGLHQVLDGKGCYHKDPTVVDSAHFLMEVLYPNGIGFIHQGMLAQDGLTHDLIDKMKAEPQASKLESLGLSNWRDLIVEDQAAVEAARKTRATLTTEDTTPPLVDAVKRFDTAFRGLVQELNTEHEDPASTIDKKLIEAILTPLKDAMATARARVTKTAKAKEKKTDSPKAAPTS